MSNRNKQNRNRNISRAVFFLVGLTLFVLGIFYFLDALGFVTDTNWDTEVRGFSLGDLLGIIILINLIGGVFLIVDGFISILVQIKEDTIMQVGRVIRTIFGIFFVAIGLLFAWERAIFIIAGTFFLTFSLFGRVPKGNVKIGLTRVTAPVKKQK